MSSLTSPKKTYSLILISDGKGPPFRGHTVSLQYQKDLPHNVLVTLDIVPANYSVTQTIYYPPTHALF